MIVGGKIANRQNLHTKTELSWGISGQPIEGQTFKVKAGLAADSSGHATPTEAGCGGFSYMIMKINLAFIRGAWFASQPRVEALTRVR